MAGSARDAALEEAAKLLDAALIAKPLDETEEHVNHVLAALAAHIRGMRSARPSPPPPGGVDAFRVAGHHATDKRMRDAPGWRMQSRFKER